jgi:hypothetical protein
MRFASVIGGTLSARLASPAAPPHVRPSIVVATEVVVGVAEEGSGAPIAGAQVYFPDLRSAAYTNWMGEARFSDVPQGTHRIRVRRVGYAPSETQLQVGSKTVGPVFMLERLPPTLDTVEVKAKVTAIDLPLFLMERRRQMGIGRFITDSVLLAHRSDDLPTMLATRLPGLQASTGFSNLVKFKSRRDCPVAVYLDDIRVTAQRDPYSRDSLYDLFPIVGPADLAGVEYYQDGAVPPQYRRFETSAALGRPALPCLAVVLLWSRWR